MLMLVNLADPKNNKRWLSKLGFVLLVIGPWAVMLWLFWPRH
jgi:hypothetical protein